MALIPGKIKVFCALGFAANAGLSLSVLFNPAFPQEPLAHWLEVSLIPLSLIVLPLYLLGYLVWGNTLLLLSTLLNLFVWVSSEKVISLSPLWGSLGVAVLGYFYWRRFENQAHFAQEALEELLAEGRGLVKRSSNFVTERQVLSRKMRRYSLLKEATDAFSSELELRGVSQGVVEWTQKIFGKEGSVLLYLLDPVKESLALYASRLPEGGPTIKEKRGDICDAWLMKERRALMISDLNKDYRFTGAKFFGRRPGFRSLVSAPLMVEDQFLGILRINHPEKEYFTQDDLRVLDIMGDLAAVAVQNANLYARTEELAITDGLTGLYVVRHLMERLEEELARAKRHGGDVSVVLCDLDHFKNYNDRYGHVAGDLLLQRVAQVLRECVRPGDVLARYGGEEFVVVLSGQVKEARRLAERIRARMEETVLDIRGQQTGITLSAGVGSFPQEAYSRDELLRVADKRLYKAKSAGRNQVCSE
ncbi:MAG: sensor domain-containing diguanylate cyclase [Candidatus Omnitrophica bacterium]|nr:sensor domain-containing diguanylate cyclase [Candidatus Omnitrophota bacterium]